ncbi:MAG TPA: serine/threonine-protein kinase [Lacipirellulaceae bacterium]|nr:serine/threonine-protein kinase [Lacipirellulaceae bacterium]
MALSANALAVAETIEAPRHAALGAPEEGSPRSVGVKPRMALVAGATPHLSGETHALLRRRLRIVAVLLFIGFGSFLVWSRVMSFLDPNWREYHPLLYSHIGVTALLGLLAWKLCAKCNLSLPTLRVAETVLFGAPAAFFVALNFKRLQVAAAMDHPHVPMVIGGWMLLIFSYSLLVPNTWRRAAVVICLFAAAPVAVNLLAYWRLPSFAALVDHQEFQGVITEQALIVAIAAMTGIVGVNSINTLRREAFAAKQLGQYRLKRLLGSGGMGEVYLAEHQMMKRPCAVKVIRPEKAGDPQVLARFEREVRATAKLSHWNSVDIYDYGRTEDGTFYYVMEFLPGHNLGELVDDYGPLPAARIVYLMRQVCDALAEAHGHGLVHRDLKPANIYCAYRGGVFDVAKVLDFGLAKPLSDATDAGLTQEGSITGSPLFMAPEQATSSDSVDARSDVYSLGAVLYFMATGRPPFQYTSPLKVMIAHASEDPEPPRLLNAQISAELEEIILRALEKRPDDRFQSVVELREALEQMPVEGEWSASLAAQWWHNHGCPQRKAMAAEAMELAAV